MDETTQTGIDQKVSCPTTIFSNRVARSDQELQTAQQIRHDAYVSAGWLDANPSKRFADEYDSLPNAETHILACRGIDIGTMRTTVHNGVTGWDRVPSMSVFGERLFYHVREYAFVELSRFAISPSISSMARQAQLALLNNAVYAADKYNCRYMVAAVRDSHVSYYERLEFVSVEPARPYPGLKFDTALMVMDWHSARPRLVAHHIFNIVFKFPRADNGVT